MKATTIRLTALQNTQIAKLALKLGVGKADVIRFAIARLAEQEGIVRTPKP